MASRRQRKIEEKRYQGSSDDSHSLLVLDSRRQVKIPDAGESDYGHAAHVAKCSRQQKERTRFMTLTNMTKWDGWEVGGG